MLVYRYNINNSKKAVKKPEPSVTVVSNASTDLTLARAKSLSVEIKETHENKNQNIMPLSGFFETKQNVDSDEEEEKLVSKDPITPQMEEKYNELDYIMDNFEDINFDDIRNIDLFKNLSAVSLSDEIDTPQLKSYISKTLLKRKSIVNIGKASNSKSNKKRIQNILTTFSSFPKPLTPNLTHIL